MLGTTLPLPSPPLPSPSPQRHCPVAKESRYAVYYQKLKAYPDITSSSSAGVCAQRSKRRGLLVDYLPCLCCAVV